jgi:hypothetical protein
MLQELKCSEQVTQHTNRNWCVQDRLYSTQTETDMFRTGYTAHKQKQMCSEQVTQHTNRNWCVQNRLNSTQTETDVFRTGYRAHKHKLMCSEQVTEHTSIKWCVQNRLQSTQTETYNTFILWRCDPTRGMASSYLRFSRSHTTTHHSC